MLVYVSYLNQIQVKAITKAIEQKLHLGKYVEPRKNYRHGQLSSHKIHFYTFIFKLNINPFKRLQLRIYAMH